MFREVPGIMVDRPAYEASIFLSLGLLSSMLHFTLHE